MAGGCSREGKTYAPGPHGQSRAKGFSISKTQQVTQRKRTNLSETQTPNKERTTHPAIEFESLHSGSLLTIFILGSASLSLIASTHTHPMLSCPLALYVAPRTLESFAAPAAKTAAPCASAVVLALRRPGSSTRRCARLTAAMRKRHLAHPGAKIWSGRGGAGELRGACAHQMDGHLQERGGFFTPNGVLSAPVALCAVVQTGSDPRGPLRR